MTRTKKLNQLSTMKKLAILFSLIFVCGIIAASAQSSATTEKQNPKTENVKSNDAPKATGCCARSTKSCKAGSMKCCAKDKAEKSPSHCSDKSETVISDRKESSAIPNNK